MKCYSCKTKLTDNDKLPGPGDVYVCPKCEAENYGPKADDWLDEDEDDDDDRLLNQ